ncbi:MAG: hypothetical protein RSG52_13265 [Terrisporobacter sp.]|uniref:hypothetical protein n=1 Tax=Terrisporobacter sp. TaxID=1965305 RepID=UPI002FC9E7AB
MKKQMTMKAYMLQKCFIEYGIINGIINVIIFNILEGKHPDATFGLMDIIADFGFTTFLLGIILFYYAMSMTSKDLDKGKFTVEEYKDNKLVSMLPKKKFPAAICVGLIVMIATAAVVLVISMALPLPLNVKNMGLFKGVACTIAGAITGYLTITNVSSTCEESLSKCA